MANDLEGNKWMNETVFKTHTVFHFKAHDTFKNNMSPMSPEQMINI